MKSLPSTYGIAWSKTNYQQAGLAALHHCCSLELQHEVSFFTYQRMASKSNGKDIEASGYRLPFASAPDSAVEATLCSKSISGAQGLGAGSKN